MYPVFPFFYYYYYCFLFLMEEQYYKPKTALFSRSSIKVAVSIFACNLCLLL